MKLIFFILISLSIAFANPEAESILEGFDNSRIEFETKRVFYPNDQSLARSILMSYVGGDLLNTLLLFIHPSKEISPANIIFPDPSEEILSKKIIDISESEVVINRTLKSKNPAIQNGVEIPNIRKESIRIKKIGFFWRIVEI